MRILHVLDHSLPETSGYALRTLNIIIEQRRLGWTTFHVTGPRHASSDNGVEAVESLEFYRTSSARPMWVRHAPMDFVWGVLALRFRLRALIDDLQPDLLHAHSPCTTGLAAMGLGLPVVYEMRTLWEEGSVLAGRLRQGSMAHNIARRLESFVLHRASAVVTISEGLRAEVLRRGVPTESISIIANGVDARHISYSHIDRDEARKRLGIRESFLVGYIGSLYGWEGIGLLIDALGTLRRQGLDVGLLIVGNGPDEDNLRMAADQAQISDHVIFAGRIPHDEVGASYDAADVMVYPRLEMELTQRVTPLKPLEAMAMAKPVIASDVGGHRELILDEETGILFPAGDVTELAKAIQRIIQEPDTRTRLVSSGRRFVQEQRTWSAVVRGYESIYDKVLRTPPR
jgi:glycogen synthase